MNSSTPSGSCIVEADADVTGPGIRISIYALSLSVPILSLVLHKLEKTNDFREFRMSVTQALSIQGVALLGTAVYQTFRSDLTLFHAICIIHYLSILGVNIYSKGKYKGMEKMRAIVEFTLTALAAAFFIAFSIYVWATAPRFGSQPECNSSTLYVIFGTSIHATSPVLRWLMVAVIAIPIATMVIILFITVLGVVCIRAMMKRGGQVTRNGAPVQDTKEPWTGHLALLALDIYLIASLEQTISRNHVSEEERKWSFGQIIALLMLLGASVELLNLLLVALGNRGAARSDPESSQELMVRH